MSAQSSTAFMKLSQRPKKSSDTSSPNSSNESPSSKKLSGSLLNMKFMRTAELSREQEEEEKQAQKVKSSAEWTFRDKISTVKKKKAPKAISFGEMYDLIGADQPVGRQTWGELRSAKKRKKVDDKELDEEQVRARGGVSRPKSAKKEKHEKRVEQ